MNRPSRDAALFHEEQRFRQTWIWPLVLLPAGLIWYIFIGQIFLLRPFGGNPAPNWLVWLLFIFFGLAFPWMMFALRMTVMITHEALYVRYFPFFSRRIQIGEIDHCDARTYAPIGEYGGWGIRGFARNRAYNVSGNRGVQLVLVSGRRLLLGSRRPEDLARALVKAGVRLGN
jgi:hypothetical protein